jgi:hypothetical protein
MTQDGKTIQRYGDTTRWFRMSEICSERIKWHKEVPEDIKAKVGSEEELRVKSSSKLFGEAHIRAIFGVVPALELSGWLTAEQARREIIDEVKDKHRGSSIGLGPSEKQVVDAAARWKALIKAAEDAYTSLADEKDEKAGDRRGESADVQ